MPSSSPSGKRRMLLIGGVVLAVGVAAIAIVMLRGDRASAPRTAAKTAAPLERARPTLPDDAAGRRARLEALRYLEQAEDGAFAVIDDSVEKRSYFARVQGDVLTAKVSAITSEQVTLVDPIAGEIVLAHRGRDQSPPAVHPAMEVRSDKVPVHYAPGVDPAKVAADQAMVDAYIATRPRGTGGGGNGGGGGGGNGGGGGGGAKGAAGGGRGGGMDPTMGGGPGRQRHQREREAEAARTRDPDDE